MFSLIGVAVIVHLANFANVPAATVADARAEVDRLFGEIGVGIDWRDEPMAGRRDVIHVTLLPYETGDLRHESNAVLGAAVQTEYGTKSAWIFARRVESESKSYAVP